MSAAYSSRFCSTNSLALRLVLDRLDLVEEDGVDRRLRAHHRDRGARAARCSSRARTPGRPSRRGRRRTPCGRSPRSSARSPRRPPMIIFAPCRMMPWRSTSRADHEAGHVGQEEQRHVERVAGPDEARRLVGRVDEQHAALHLRLVRDDPDRPAVEPREADDELLGPARVHLAERVGVDERVDQVLDVERGRSRRPGRPRETAPLGRRLGGRRRRAAPRASSAACTRGSAARGRSPPRRTRRGSGRIRRPTCACGRRPSPRASPSRRSPSRPSAASPGTSTRCRRA